MSSKSQDEYIQQINGANINWSENNKQGTIKIIVDKNNAKWFTSKLYDYVDKNIINVKINSNHSKHSIELDITIIINNTTTITYGELSALVLVLKGQAILNYLKKLHRK